MADAVEPALDLAIVEGAGALESVAAFEIALALGAAPRGCLPRMVELFRAPRAGESHSGAGRAGAGRLRIAFPGGRTAAALFDRLASEPLRSRIDWWRVEVFFADERAVPPDHADSNFRLARERLFDQVGLPEDAVHRMRGEADDLEAAAREYETLLERPLDLVVLGVGEDGHIASLFPGSPLVADRTRRVAVARDCPKPPPTRLTLTPRALAEAREVMVLAGGSDKADAVGRALAPAGETSATPARLVRERRWIVDRAAAAQLPAALRGDAEAT